MSKKNIVGKLINFRGLVYAPVNEQGVVFLFGKVAADLGMYVELIRPGYPDCIAKRYIGKDRWEDVRVEFEFKSNQFHHDPRGADIIICWEHDWKDCPSHIEVIELKEVIKGLENIPIEAPDKAISEFTPDYHYNKGTKETIVLFKRLDEKVSRISDEIYKKFAKYRIRYHSPKRNFAAIKIMKSGLNIQLFTDSKRIKGVEQISGEGGQKWGRIYVKKPDQISTAYEALKKSHELIKKAIKENRPTGWWAEAE